LLASWNRVSDSIALVLLYKTSDYSLALPNFIDELEVPYIAIAEVAPQTTGLKQTECVIFYRTLIPELLN